jgi:hypothetical protein
VRFNELNAPQLNFHLSRAGPFQRLKKAEKPLTRPIFDVSLLPKRLAKRYARPIAGGWKSGNGEVGLG